MFMWDADTTLFLSKLAPLAFYPVGATILLALLGALFEVLNYRRVARATAAAALLVLWICSTPAFAAWAYTTLEQQYPPRALSNTPDADVAIVLGGAIRQPIPPRVEAELTAPSGRILHAARLYQAGKVK